MTLAELMAQYEERARVAAQIGSAAPVAKLYRAILDELAGVDGVESVGESRGEYMTVREVAEFLAMSEKWVYTNQAELESEKFGRSVRFNRRAVERYSRGR